MKFMYTDTERQYKFNAYFSPTLNFHNTEKGLQYAFRSMMKHRRYISINKEDRNTGAGIWNKWVAKIL